MSPAPTHHAIVATLHRAAAALRRAEVPFMLGGSLACWIRGGPRSEHDIDIVVAREDAERALQGLRQAGMRAERPPEDWLLKAWDGDVLVDVIFRVMERDVTRDRVAAAEQVPVAGVTMPVMSCEDVLVAKLLALDDERLELTALLRVARALSERIDWADVRRRTRRSPYARAFFSLIGELDVVDDPGQGSRPALCVFSPRPVLTVTVESTDGDPAEIHLHAGGQGFWVARMATALGADATLCTALGGESGRVLRGLIESSDVDLVAVGTEGANGAYVHDRRTGRRDVVAEQPGARLSRHELDQLYGTTLTAGLDAGVVLLTGPADQGTVPADVYARLSKDLRRNGARVLGDLSATSLTRALAGGLDLLKVSDEELVAEGWCSTRDEREVRKAVERLVAAGAENVVVTREDEPAIGWLGGRPVSVSGPRFEPIEPRGAGDSLFAAAAVGMAEGASIEQAVRLGMAAGALNVTRRGLGSGDRRAIERLLDQVELRPLTPGNAPAEQGGHASR